MKPPQHVVWVREGSCVDQCDDEVWHVGVPAGPTRQRVWWPPHGDSILGGDCRMPAAVLLVAQACKSGVALLASQSSVIDPDNEEAAAEP
jgi:hypothetical protein